MKKLILTVFIAIAITSQAQPVYVDRIGFKLESIADINIGWMKIYKYTTAPKGKQLGNRVYSATQIGYSQQFIEWMQQSYLPKGCLGDAGYYQNNIPKFSNTNSVMGNAIAQHDHALPHMFGALSKMYMFLKKDAQGKFVPQNNLAEYWQIEANQLKQISSPVSFISSAEQYYFVLPDFSSHPKGYQAENIAASDLLGFIHQKQLQDFRHFFLPPKIIQDNPQFVVIMTRDNELPFEKITIGEFFKMAEKQFPEWQKIKPVTSADYAIAQTNLARLKEKYKNKWNEIAELRLSRTQLDLYSFIHATEGYEDMFENTGSEVSFPIMRVKKSVMDLCKTDQPQWLVIRWSVGMSNSAFAVHLHQSILENFNFEYVYNYFFNPQKVKGIPYKPLRSPTYEEPAIKTELSTTAKNKSADKNNFFFDDFSTTASGKKPMGWQTRLANSGTTAIVSNPEGLDGNWVELRGHYMNTIFQKNPLPQNFKLSYDVAVAENFTWGAKGLTLQLAYEPSPGNAESYIKLKLRPGSNGRDGEVTLETKFPFPPGYSNGTKWYVAKGFSNNKKMNLVKVTIRKTGETLQVFIDNEKIAEYEKAIPLAHPFTSLSFDCAGNSAEADKFFISNVAITKEQ